jgi:hypothetical protein
MSLTDTGALEAFEINQYESLEKVLHAAGDRVQRWSVLPSASLPIGVLPVFKRILELS